MTITLLRPTPVKAVCALPSERRAPEHKQELKFGPWKGWGLLDPTYRLHRPIAAMTRDLARLHKTCRGEIREEQALEERTKRREFRWVSDEQAPLLGEGAFAEIHPHIDQLTGKPAAMKLCTVPCSGNLSVAEKERTMLHLCQSVRHVIRFYGGYFQELGGRSNLGLLMQVVPPDLSQFIETEGLPLMEVLLLLKQLLEFHIDLSALGIIHGDLTLNNLSLGEDGALIVYDFGLSHFKKEVVSNSGCSIQTVGVRDPQIIVGKQYGSEADLWSIGCVVFHAYTGESFVQASVDNEFWRLKILGQLIQRIGEPPASYFEGSRIQRSQIPSYQGQLATLEQELNLASRLKNGFPNLPPLFLELFQGIFRWENRIAPEEALRLCETLIAAESV